MLLDDVWKAQDEFRKRPDAMTLHSVIDLSAKHLGRNEILQLNDRAKNDPAFLAELRSKIESLQTAGPVNTMIKKEVLAMIDAYLLRSTPARSQQTATRKS
jgi:hypothetical protein